MNKSFKVVFNKARGALMVVNEVTSSVQAKGTKTVIAAAVATMMAGGAVAADTQWVEAPEDAVVKAPTDGKFTEASYLYKYADDGKKGDPVQFILATENTKFDKNLWVVSEDADTSVNGLWASGKEVKLENVGNIYVTGKTSYKTKAMGAAAGATIVNSGTIVAKNAYGMIVGSGQGEKAKIVNAATGKIIVEGQGAAIELGGKDLNGTAVNNGVIEVVGNFDKDAEPNTKWAHGVLINTATNTFENNGTINANAEGTFAIMVNNQAQNTTLKFGEKSDVNGLIYLTKGTTDISFSGTKDLLKIKNAEGTTANLSIQDGADITLADQMGSVYEKVDVQNGKLTASIWHDTTEFGDNKDQLQNDNLFKNVTVGEKGVFNITKLNSGGDKDQTKAEAKPHDKLLIKDMNLTLNGGDLQVAGKTYEGKVVIGTSKTTDTLTINEGAYKFADVNFGSGFKSRKASKLYINGGQLTVGSLDFSNGEVKVDGQLNADKLVWTDKKYGQTPTSSEAVGSLTVAKDGTLTTVAKDNLATKGENGAWKLSDAVSHMTIEEGGVLALTDAFSAKASEVKDYLTQAKKAFGGDVVFKNVELTDKEVAWDPTLGMATINTSVTLAKADENGAVMATLNKEKVGVASLKVTEGTKTVAITGEGSLTVRGDTASGNIFDGVAELESAEVSNLVLGLEAKNQGVVNAKTLKATSLDVVGNFTAQNVEVDNAYVDGTLALNSIKVNDNGSAEVKDGTLNLLGVTEKDAKEITGKVAVTGSGLITTNQAAAEAFISTIEDEKIPAVLYVDRVIKLADGAQVQIGGQVTQNIALLADPQTPTTTNASITIENDGYAAVDASKFIGTKDAVFGANTDVTVKGGELDLINVNKTGEVKLGASVTVSDNGEIDTDSLYLNATAGEKGVVAINYRDGVVADKTVDARLKGLFTKGASAKELAILNALDKDVYLDTKTDTFNALGNKAFEQATGGNATAGVFNVAYDANAQVTDAIVRHQLATHTGMGAWADVFYAKNEAKEMYGNSGYSADIYGGVLGFDATFSCGATGGLAITMGKADAESEGGVLANKLDSDFWGVSVYTAKDFSGLNVKADLGYMDFSNDFSGLGDASDASTVTFGVRGDFTAYQNGAFSIAPHFGLRYTHIDTDAVAFNDAQTMNVFEAPIGVKFAGTFETTGWKVVPSYDFTIVPQFGDKEVEAFGTAGDITILNGGLVNNVFGIEASKGNLSFGLNGVYGVGAHDRSNTQINANVRYNF